MILFSGPAKIFANLLTNAENIPVDVSDTIEVELPDYADNERLKR